MFMYIKGTNNTSGRCDIFNATRLHIPFAKRVQRTPLPTPGFPVFYINVKTMPQFSTHAWRMITVSTANTTTPSCRNTRPPGTGVSLLIGGVKSAASVQNLYSAVKCLDFYNVMFEDLNLNQQLDGANPGTSQCQPNWVRMIQILYGPTFIFQMIRSRMCTGILVDVSLKFKTKKSLAL
jgi:hypothetical protein